MGMFNGYELLLGNFVERWVIVGGNSIIKY